MSGKDVIEEIAKRIPSLSQKNKLSIAVLASGNGSNLQALMDRAKTKGSQFVITTVITNIPTAKALVRAKTAGLDHHLVDHNAFAKKSDFERALLSILAKKPVDIVVLAGFMRVLGKTFLRAFDHRIINLHPSLLPKHPGLNAVEKALLAKDDKAGCTVHLVDEGLDTGPIIAQASCPIDPNDDVKSLSERIKTLEHQLLPSVINDIALSTLRFGCP